MSQNTDQSRARKAIIFARVSSTEQEQGYSIEAQRARLEAYCDRRQLKVIKIFEIVESSTKGDRKKFMEMVAAAKAERECVAIVADKVDRIQRSFREYPALDELVQAGSIELHFHTENYIIHKGSASHERTMWSIGVVMAQNYVDSLKDNVKRSIDFKIRSGEWPQAAPLGYLNVTDAKGRGDILVDSVRAPIIRRLFEAYATGTKTLKTLTVAAGEWGLTNQRGNKGSCSRSQIHYILGNPFYYGMMKINGRLYEHRYERLITKELYDNVQEKLHGWQHKPFKSVKHDHVLKGLVTCASSGRMITADFKTKKYVNGGTGSWTYLRSFQPGNPDKMIFVREEEVLRQVEDVLKALQLDAELLSEIKHYLREVNAAEKNFGRRRLSELQAQQTKLQGRVDRLMDLLLDEAIGRDEYETKRRQLKEQQTDLEAEMTALREGDDSFKQTLAGILTIMAESHRLWLGSNDAEKRQLIGFLFSNLQLDGTRLCYSLRKPFDRLATLRDCKEWLPLIDSIRTCPEARRQILGFAPAMNSFIENTIH